MYVGVCFFADTTVVIIVSVSLAVLVCAIIPLIFYGHCRGNLAETQANMCTTFTPQFDLEPKLFHVFAHRRFNESFRLFVSEGRNRSEANKCEVSDFIVIYQSLF